VFRRHDTRRQSPLHRLLRSGHRPQGDIDIPGLTDIEPLIDKTGINILVTRIPSRSDQPDIPCVHFRQAGWTLASWYPSTGRLVIGPRSLSADTIAAAWATLQANLP